MYLEYDNILEAYEERVQEVIEGKLMEHLQKVKKWKAIEDKISKAMKKEIENRKANKYSSTSSSGAPSAFHQDDELFVGQLEETQDLM
jgi:hypothetical protein